MPRKVIQIHAKIYIRANYLKKSSRKLAEYLGCSAGPVQQYRNEASLIVSEELQNKFRGEAQKGRTKFTPAEDIILKENYLKVPIKRLAKCFPHSSMCVNIRMRQLGLVVPVELAQKRKRAALFIVGQESHNKGKKQTDYMTPEQITKTKATRFKKGNSPHNELFDGAIRTRVDTKTGRPYKYIRIDKGNWQLLHRHNWEKKNGPIPEGRVIIFKDENPLNCEPENLACITLEENGRRVAKQINSRTPELKRAIRLKNKLTFKVKNHERQRYEHPK